MTYLSVITKLLINVEGGQSVSISVAGQTAQYPSPGDTSMSVQGYSVGRDVTLVLILPTGAALRLDKITGFSSNPVNSDQKIKGLDGITDHLRFFDGWSGSFKLERRSAVIDQYFAQAEANFYNGEDDPPAVLHQTIREPDGTISQYRFERILLTYDDAGDWAGDKSVSQSVSFMASRRIQQA